MKYIAHRGNYKGKQLANENNPEYILEAINNNFDCEIDLRIKNSEYYLGHDYSQYKISVNWLLENKNRLWVHIKDKSLLEQSLLNDLHWFWHENDTITLTSKGIKWCYPSVIIQNSVLNQTTITEDLLKKIKNNYFYGICYDSILDKI